MDAVPVEHVEIGSLAIERGDPVGIAESRIGVRIKRQAMGEQSLDLSRLALIQQKLRLERRNLARTPRAERRRYGETMNATVFSIELCVASVAVRRGLIRKALSVGV